MIIARRLAERIKMAVLGICRPNLRNKAKYAPTARIVMTRIPTSKSWHH